MRRFFGRFLCLFRRRHAERELEREIESHLSLLREDFERQGFPSADAVLAARRAMGGVDQAKELHREARSFLWVEHLLRDVRYGASGLARNPGFTLVVVIALALGIGLNTTVFGVYNALVLKGLPVANPNQLVRLKHISPMGRSTSYREYLYLRDRNTVYSGVALANSVRTTITIGGSSKPVTGNIVSANYFAVLGVLPRTGRTFLSEEDQPGANPVAVISHRLWQRELQGDPNIAGRTIRLNGLPCTVVGIAPQEFTGSDPSPQDSSFWVPLSMMEQLNPSPVLGWREQWGDVGQPGLHLLARLKDGSSREQARAETQLLMRNNPTGYRDPDPHSVITLHRVSRLNGWGSPAFLAATLFLVNLILFAACANVANMMLARGVARRGEFGTRLALGASRGRIIQQLMTESLLLALLGGVAGVLLSSWAARLLWDSMAAFWKGPGRSLAQLDTSPDAGVFVYALALSAVTAIAFGLAPALESSRTSLGAAIKQERSRLGGWLLGAQIAVSVLLLFLSTGVIGGFARSFAGPDEMGFEARGIYTLRANWGVGNIREGRANQRRVSEQLRMLPELSGVVAGGVPIQEVGLIQITGPSWSGQAAISYAQDGYFETVGIRLLRGRGFTPHEDEMSRVAVISQSTAKRLWPNEDPLGKQFSTSRTNFGGEVESVERHVVGVVRDVRFGDITQAGSSHVYLPGGGTTLLFRIRAEREQSLAAVRSVVESVDSRLLSNLDVANLEEGAIANWRGLYRACATYAGTIVALSVLLASVGIYGVAAFLVTQRTREIAIRKAMGATSVDVIRSIVIRGLRPALIGIPVGLTASLLVGTLALSVQGPTMTSLSLLDPIVPGGLTLVLAVTILASAIPAWRATRLDPMVSIRHE